MYVVARRLDDGIYWTRVNLQTLQQSSWSNLTGKTYSAPSVDFLADTLYIAIRGTDNRIYITTVNTLNGAQGSWVRLSSGTTTDAPSIKMWSNPYSGPHGEIIVKGAASQTTRITLRYVAFLTILALLITAFLSPGSLASFSRLPGLAILSLAVLTGTITSYRSILLGLL